MVDQQAAERRGIRRVVGQDSVDLALVVEAVALEPVGQERTRDLEQRPPPGKRSEAPISHERMPQMDAGIAGSHERKTTGP